MIICQKILGAVLFLFLITANGLSQEALDIKRVEKKIDSLLVYFSGDNPGAVVTVIKSGNIILNKAYGLSNVHLNEKMTVDKTFNLVGLSKAFASVSILKLVEKNKLALDDNLSDIFPNFPEYGKKVKIRNLLNHTSGLINYDIEIINSNDQVYDFLKNQKTLIFEPDSIWQHSYSDYALLVKIVEEISNMSYQDFTNKYIFKKLLMNNTFFNDDIKDSNFAIGHFKEGKEYVARQELNNVYGEQGVFTNSLDFAKWDKALYTNKLLHCESLNKIFSVINLKQDKINRFYGFGWILMEKNGVSYYWHGGSGSGYTDLVLHLPDTKATVLILSNRNDGYDFLKLARLIMMEFDKELKLL